MHTAAAVCIFQEFPIPEIISSTSSKNYWYDEPLIIKVGFRCVILYMMRMILRFMLNCTHTAAHGNAKIKKIEIVSCHVAKRKRIQRHLTKKFTNTPPVRSISTGHAFTVNYEKTFKVLTYSTATNTHIPLSKNQFRKSKNFWKEIFIFLDKFLTNHFPHWIRH